MANAPIQIACPECSKKLTVTQELLGKKVRCKGCSKVFLAAQSPAANPAKAKEEKKEETSSPAKAAQALAEEDDPEFGKRPYGMTDTVLIPRCPNCANELLSANDVVCVYCGYNNRTRTIGKTKKTYDVSGGDKFLWLLPGIICAIVCITVLIMNIVYLVKIDSWVEKEENQPDPPWYAFIAHTSIKLWMVIISLGILWVLGKYAVKRLIFENKPPEEEIL